MNKLIKYIKAPPMQFLPIVLFRILCSRTFSVSSFSVPLRFVYILFILMQLNIFSIFLKVI